VGIQSGDFADVLTGLVLAGGVFAVGWWRTTRIRSRMHGSEARIQTRMHGDEARNISADIVELKGDGSYSVEVVGESAHQSALEAIAGGRTRDSARKHVDAVLILEDDNKYDPNAVRVEVAGKTVGYLSREDAPAYRAHLAALGQPKARGACHARIVGGWDRGVGDQGSYGVYLDVEEGTMD
jgi:hypothetical protein